MSKTPTRADAARNKERILAVARQCFIEHGVDVPLDTIAKRAGVGAGTFYRHFSGREALVGELLTAEMGNFEQEFLDLQLSKISIEEKLDIWSNALQRWMTTYAGLPEPLRLAVDGGAGALVAGCQRVIDMTEVLVREARAIGVAEDFVTGRDYYRTALALAWVAAETGARGDADVKNLYRIARDGWRRRG